MTKPYEAGNPDSRICLLGEAPSSVEIKLSQPFVGPSGSLLNDLLRQAGIPRSSCYICNVFEDIVRKSDSGECFNTIGDLLYSPRGGFTALGRAQAERCLERLARSRANVIVPLGGVALALLYGDHRIGKWRGSILPTDAPGVVDRKMVPTYHPAFLLRGNMLNKYTVINDLRRAAEESSHPQIRLLERNLIINPLWPDVVDFFEQAKKAKMIATDIEVLNNHVSCFSIALSPVLCMCIPILDERGRNRWTEEEEAWIWKSYAEIMGDENITKLNQNIIFDITFLLDRNNIVTRGRLEDTMVAHHILYPDFPKGLDFLCSTYTREPYYKDDGKLWSKPWTDMEKFWLYNAKDSATVYEIWENLQDELEDGYMDTYRETMDMFPALMYMMLHGIRVDEERLLQTKADVNALLLQKENELKAVSDYEFNPGSPAQMIKYFYLHKGIKPYVNPKTRQPTCDDKAMTRIIKRYGLPEARLVQEIRALRKLISSYLEVQYGEDLMIRCSYNPRGTTSGRLSSSQTIQGTGMNLQNLDPRFKSFLVPEQE